jgi:uncharacterized protein YhfF
MVVITRAAPTPSDLRALRHSSPEASTSPILLGRDWCEGQRLAAWIESGEKWATSFPLGLVPLPRIGQVFAVASLGIRGPINIQITAIAIAQMREVCASFAVAEGNRSLGEWQRVHRDFCYRHGYLDPDPAMVQLWFRPLAPTHTTA